LILEEKELEFTDHLDFLGSDKSFDDLPLGDLSSSDPDPEVPLQVVVISDVDGTFVGVHGDGMCNESGIKNEGRDNGTGESFNS